MDRTRVMKLLSIVPARSARRQSGTLFYAREGRAAGISRFLGWMSPLNPTSKEDQASLGLTVAHPRQDDSESADDAAEEELFS